MVTALTLFMLEITEVVPHNRYFNTAMLGGYIKDVLTLFKYIPQLYWNYTRKSTKGYNIWAVHTDLASGFFSYLQMLLDSIVQGSVNIFKGNLNIGKFGLSVISIVFNLVFVFQHYCLYTNHLLKDNSSTTYVEDMMSNSDEPLSKKCDKEQ